MIRLLDYFLGGTQSVANDKIRQVGAFKGHGTQDHRLIIGPNP
jgi:hypothetical protein